MRIDREMLIVEKASMFLGRFMCAIGVMQESDGIVATVKKADKIYGNTFRGVLEGCFMSDVNE